MQTENPLTCKLKVSKRDEYYACVYCTWMSEFIMVKVFSIFIIKKQASYIQSRKNDSLPKDATNDLARERNAVNKLLFACNRFSRGSR